MDASLWTTPIFSHKANKNVHSFDWPVPSGRSPVYAVYVFQLVAGGKMHSLA